MRHLFKLKEDILKRVVVTKDNCWEWQGSVDKYGYGHIRRGSRPGKLHYVHRVMMDASPAQQVNHKCDNSLCCNPEHLYIGTQSQNLKDAYGRGRRLPVDIKGEKHHNCKLTEMEVLKIRELLVEMSTREIANMYDVSMSTIKAIKTRQNWRHI